MSRPLNVGLLGLGGVGRGLLELWREHPDPRFRIAWATDSTGAVVGNPSLEAPALLEAKLKGDLSTLRGARFLPQAKPADVANQHPVDILVNLLPCDYEAGEPALSILERGLRAGQHVVSAEKASIVLGFDRLRRAREQGGAQLRYSACVGGSVPFIPLLEWLSHAHQIRSVTGVLNATTTYVLTELEARRASPEEIIQRARNLGILERDARLDLDGFDLAAKAAIVHNTIYKDSYPWNKIRRQGIQPVLDEPQNVQAGTRLVAHIRPNDVWLEAKTLPMHSPLRVYGLENALLVDTPNAGELYVRGVGAGGRGTATNVYGDLLRVAANLQGGEPSGRSSVPTPPVHRNL